MITWFRYMILFPAILLVLTITSCSATKKSWYKLGTTEHEQAIDNANCFSRARKIAENRFQSMLDTDVGSIDKTSSFRTIMNRYQAKRNMEVIFQQCLENKGYRLIELLPKISREA